MRAGPSEPHVVMVGEETLATLLTLTVWFAALERLVPCSVQARVSSRTTTQGGFNNPK